MKIDLEILFEDAQIMVCRKPAGVAVQTAKAGQQDLVSLLKNVLAAKQKTPQIHVVHRLDQPVEGVMVFARDNRSAAALSRQLQAQGVEKHYHAVIEGRIEPEQGELVDYLLRDGRNNCSKVVAAGTKGAKQAALCYRTLHSLDGRSLLEIHLKTGRHHQIRVQMAHAGYPLVGDRKYNPRSAGGYLPVGLCSVRLAFLHPVTRERMAFEVEPRGEAFGGFYGVKKGTFEAENIRTPDHCEP